MIIGGIINDKITNSTVLYHPETNEFEVTQSMKVRRRRHTCCYDAKRGNVYAVGGEGDSTRECEMN